ncbi:MAG: nucleoside-diphosphate sugar epimerase [Parcubacteria group bacterium]|nr:nucleoside-diphosphate sugar epimerase [Parcubacteria group bacterium]
MKNFLVTGGEGFIGSRIVGLTEAQSYDLKSGSDILDTQKLTDACENMEGIFHCAAKISVPESIKKPDEYQLHNVEGTKSVIEVAENGRNKIVFSSSAAVYGESDHEAKETDSLHPMSPYAQNKADGEMLLKDSNVPNVILRYFNVYGPGQSAAYAGVITAFISAALKNEDLVLFGDGEQVRDFVYVDDVARANIAAMESDIGGAEVFNIGSGTKTSITELAQEIITLTGSSSNIRHEAPRLGDIVYSQADVSKASKLLGWRAEVSLENGLRKTIASFI